MSKNFKRITSVMVVFMLLLTLFSGCGEKAEEEKAGNQETASATEETDNEKAEETDKEKAEEPDKEKAEEPGEPTVLTVALFDRGQTYEDGYTLQDNPAVTWVNENFGKPNNIKVEYVLIPRDQEVDKLNLLMASGSAPDIIFTYNTDLFYSYAMDGGLTELTGLIDEFAPNLRKTIGTFGDYNGGTYAVTYFDEEAGLSGQFARYIRKDWLDKLELPMPQTKDEFYDALVAFKEQDPGNMGKDKVVPFGLVAQAFSDEDWQQNTQHLNYSFVEKMTEEDFFTLPQIMYPGYKEGVRFLNKMYNDGLIDPEFALLDFGQLYEKISNGLVGSYSFNAASKLYPGGPVDTMRTQFAGQYDIIEPFENADGITVKRAWSPAGGMKIMVPVFSENAEAAIKYIEWISLDENRLTLVHGIEGENWSVVDGAPKANEDNKMIGVGNDMSIVNPAWKYENDALMYYAILDANKSWLGNLKVDTYKLASQGGTYLNPIFDRPLEIKAEYTPTLNAKYQELMIKSIMATPAEFDSVYDGLQAEYMEIGGQLVMEEKIEAYQSMFQNNGNKPLTSGNPLIK